MGLATALLRTVTPQDIEYTLSARTQPMMRYGGQFGACGMPAYCSGSLWCSTGSVLRRNRCPMLRVRWSPRVRHTGDSKHGCLLPRRASLKNRSACSWKPHGWPRRAGATGTFTSRLPTTTCRSSTLSARSTQWRKGCSCRRAGPVPGHPLAGSPAPCLRGGPRLASAPPMPFRNDPVPQQACGASCPWPCCAAHCRAWPWSACRQSLCCRKRAPPLHLRACLHAVLA